jgi:hypothetical protein
MFKRYGLVFKSTVDKGLKQLNDLLLTGHALIILALGPN